MSFETIVLYFFLVKIGALKTCSNSVCLPEDYNKMDADRLKTLCKFSNNISLLFKDHI